MVDSSGQVMSVDDEVSVERLWDDGAPVNVTTLQLKGGLATYTLVPDKGHASSRLNLVVCGEKRRKIVPFPDIFHGLPLDSS